jgi:hypothetical protein
MTERIEPEIQSGNEDLFGTTIADGSHLSDAEAAAALNTDEAKEEVVPEDPDWEKDTELFE